MPGLGLGMSNVKEKETSFVGSAELEKIKHRLVEVETILMA